jgi:diaminohydroxyphosphoribosylaminopyrimidine deaminase / 5-amino-6-(5-phosphoribosylamino)uracil reductase
MLEAIALAAAPDFRSGGNPRVGCVILDKFGAVVGRGHHRGAGFPHAEVVALGEAGVAAAGGTAVVTLEPCRHTGRTPPCTDALIAAGVSSVVFAVQDPGAHSGDGADALRAHGITVQAGVERERAEAVVREWMHVQRTGRPFVRAKCAMSLDGRVADRDGAPLQLTGPLMNQRSHEVRAQVDAIVVGTGTVFADDPQLTARPTGPVLHQPLRVAVGRRSVSASARMRGPEFRHFTAHDPSVVLRALGDEGCLSVLLEGGPTLMRAWFRAGVVDEVHWAISPIIVGSGPTALGDLLETIPVSVGLIEVVGQDVWVQGTLAPLAGE